MRIIDNCKLRKVWKYLDDRNIITDKIAAEKFQSYRLSSIIFELRHRHGLDIRDTWITNPSTGSRYKQYWLNKPIMIKDDE